MPLLERILAYYPLSIRDKQKQTKNTCIHWAVKHNQPELIKWLIPQQPKYLNQPNFYGNTPIMLAVFDNNFECVKALHSIKKYQPDLDIRNLYGRTPLMKACLNNQTNIVKYLLENNTPNLDIQDKQNQTALLYAIDHKRDNLVNLLVSHGASTRLKTNQNKNAIDRIANNKTSVALAKGYINTTINLLKECKLIILYNIDESVINIIIRYMLEIDLDEELKKIEEEKKKKAAAAKKKGKKSARRPIGARRVARRGR